MEVTVTQVFRTERQVLYVDVVVPASIVITFVYKVLHLTVDVSSDDDGENEIEAMVHVFNPINVHLVSDRISSNRNVVFLENLVIIKPAIRQLMPINFDFILILMRITQILVYDFEVGKTYLIILSETDMKRVKVHGFYRCYCLTCITKI